MTEYILIVPPLIRQLDSVKIPSDLPGDMGAFSTVSGSGFKRLVRLACVIVELLPLEPPEVSVAVVSEVTVDNSDGDVSRSFAAARTAR